MIKNSNKIKVLDHGFVALVDHMGSDKRVVDAARVSISGGEVRKTSDDTSLIRYLLRHKHTTPFEQVVFTFCVKMPIFIARQFMRHRTMSINEMSARYSVLPSDFYIPEKSRIKLQSKDNKQGSGESISEKCSEEILSVIKKHSEKSYEVYENLLGKKNTENIPEDMFEEIKDSGVARELSRMVIPTNVYTEFYFTQNLWNLMHLIRLRDHSHAQIEIQEYAKAIKELIFNFCPISMQAFEDYIQNAETFSAQEMNLIKSIQITEEQIKNSGMSKREIQEFLKKIKPVQ